MLYANARWRVSKPRQVQFLARIKGCYVTPLASSDCVCARCDFRVELILALIHCSVSQSVYGATMEWTQENALGFIELYEEMSVLWDPNHPKYYNKLHKHLPTRSSKQEDDHSAQPVRRNSRCYVAADCSSPDAA